MPITKPIDYNKSKGFFIIGRTAVSDMDDVQAQQINTDHPAVVLQQIRDNTDMLITGLKNLNSNIKHYIDGLTKHKTVAEIMHVLFNDYMADFEVHERTWEKTGAGKYPVMFSAMYEKNRQCKTILTRKILHVKAI